MFDDWLVIELTTYNNFSGIKRFIPPPEHTMLDRMLITICSISVHGLYDFLRFRIQVE